ncbi:MAG: type II TA system antitoxin MqsA family protein [Bryobacteraceae bacterium]
MRQQAQGSRDTKCFDCGKGRMVRKVTKLPHQIHGISFEVEDEASVCTACDAITIPWDRVDAHSRLVDATYRRLAGILTRKQIREARRRMGLSQRDFAEYLGVGVASVKRWETGALPDRSSSELIRLKTDPEAARQNWALLRSLLKQTGHAVMQPKKPVRRVSPRPGASGPRRSAASRDRS